MDAIFKALNDPTRRRILDLLRARDGQTLTELVDRMEMTRFGVMKHLKVLEAATLVTSRKSGRFKHHYLNAAPLQVVIDRWIEPLLAKPMARMALDLKAVLEGDDAMTKPEFVLETWIRTTPEALWAAITQPALIAKYYVNKSAPEAPINGPGRVVNRTPDGALMWEGDVLTYEPYSKLEMTFEAKWAGEAPSSRFIYEIEAQGAVCKFTIMQFDIPEVMASAPSGWSVLASGLKTLLETGEALEAEW